VAEGRSTMFGIGVWEIVLLLLLAAGALVVAGIALLVATGRQRSDR